MKINFKIFYSRNKLSNYFKVVVKTKKHFNKNINVLPNFPRQHTWRLRNVEIICNLNEEY